VPTQIEQVLNDGMGSNKSLRLSHRLESSHPPLSHPDCLMGLLDSVIGVLGCIVNHFRQYFPAGNTIAAQLVSHDLPGLTTMANQ